MKLPGAHDNDATTSAATLSHDESPVLMNARGSKKEATPVFIPNQPYHEATVQRQKLDAVLCPPLLCV